MRNIYYVGSFDPAHNGHLNTFLKASRLLNEEIKIGICNNEIKPLGMFSLSKRLTIAKATFPTNKIYVFSSYDEIKDMIFGADALVRGYRKNNEEIEKNYSKQLLSHFGMAEFQNRLYFVEIDKEYEDVSSSKIREIAKHDINMISQFVPKASFQIIKDELL